MYFRDPVPSLSGDSFCVRWRVEGEKMNEQDSNSWKKLQEKWLSRRNLIRGAAGTAAGAGLLLGSGLRLSAREDEDQGSETCGVARTLPHTTAGPFCPIHSYFPGRIDGSASPTAG